VPVGEPSDLPFHAGAVVSEASAIDGGTVLRRPRTLAMVGVGAVLVVLLGAGVTLITVALGHRGRASTQASGVDSAAAPLAATAIGTGTTVSTAMAAAGNAPTAPTKPAAEPAPTTSPTTPTPEHVPEPAPATAAAAPSEVPSVALRPGEGELLVICEPVTCELVMLDGKAMSQYPNPVAVRAGVHGVGISRQGHGGQWQQVTVAKGERAELHFKVVPVAAAKKPCGKFLQRCD
jgi:hypothetical protein